MKTSFLFSLFFACVVFGALYAPRMLYAGKITSGGASPAAASPSEAIAPGAFIRDIYNVALMFGGLIGFGAVVYGAVMYSVSGGNSAAAGEARAQITQALLGLLLLFGAYLVLATINPGLTNLNMPTLENIAVPEDTNKACGGKCPAGTSCAQDASGKSSCIALSKCAGSVYGYCSAGKCVRNAAGQFACIATPVTEGYGCTVDGKFTCFSDAKCGGKCDLAGTCASSKLCDKVK